MSLLLPIFTIIALGYVARKTGFVDYSFWRLSEKIVYYIFYPALLVSTLSTASYLDYPALAMAGALATGLVVVSVLLLVLHTRLPFTNQAYASFFQGSLRPNLFLGIAAAMALAGNEGLILAAVAIITIVPVAHLLCVPILSYFGEAETKEHAGLKMTLREVAANPLFIGSFTGILLDVTGVPLPSTIFEIIRLLGQAAIPLGMLTIGAGMHFSQLHVKKLSLNLLPVPLACLIKLVLLPATTALACSLYKVPDAAALVAIIFAALPAPMATLHLAKQLGGDEHHMSMIVTLQTALAVFTLPIMLLILS